MFWFGFFFKREFFQQQRALCGIQDLPSVTAKLAEQKKWTLASGKILHFQYAHYLIY